MSDELMHYGILRKSGRYPWGSGSDSYGRSMAFYSFVDSLKKQGIPEKDIATAIGMKVQELTGDPKLKFTVANLRDTKTIALEEKIKWQTDQATKLQAKGVSPKEIADRLGMEVGTVRLRLAQADKRKESSLRSTAEVLRKNVSEHEIVDIGLGVEHQLGIADTKLRAAVSVLRDEGYETYTIPVRNPGTNGRQINRKVLVPPGTGFSGARKMIDRIHTMGEWSENDGVSYYGLHPPLSISSKRLKVRFAEDGGADEDGMIFVRAGVKDLDMGKNNYAQVRIAIDDTHFIKGVAVKKDDLPEGIDIVFNTNKSRGTPVLGDKTGSVLKPMKDDPDNPFGSMIQRQIVGIDPKTGKERATSALNLVNEEGDWDNWRKSLPSQMLAKQPHSLIKSQLKVTREQAQARLDEINTITNPVIRKKRLQDYADQIDSDAVDLRAASMPRQQTRLIIPIPKLRPNEIYAPEFETGERVVLIRYPHGGRFEIPEVTVNNHNRTAKKLLGNAPDAIGIHPTVAKRLSGADFDGDTVVVIPNREGKIKGSNPSNPKDKREINIYDEKLKNFDPQTRYGGYEEKNGKGNFKLMKNTGLEMGVITNLITDMSIQAASPEHIIRAVKHSMVVIDAEKHKLDYKRSEEEHNIKQLKMLYQGRPDMPGKYGASTLLSQATAKERIPERKLRSAREGGALNKETGELVYVPTGRKNNKYDPKTQTYTDEKVAVTQNEKRLALTNNAFDLVRDPRDPIERTYAEHANEMKGMANAARLRADRIAMPRINTKARAVYKAEIDKLTMDLKKAEAQKPLDRRASQIARTFMTAKMQEDPALRTDPDRKKKVERQFADTARARLGLTKPVIDISDRQWDAIQSGAVSSSKLSKILKYADPKQIEELSMPKPTTVMTPAVLARVKAMLAADATNGDIAASLGISPSTLRAAIARGDLG